MRYMNLVALSLGFTLSISALANFSGDWSGSGDVSGGISLHCDSVSADVTQTETEFSLSNLDAECGFISESVDDRTYQIKGNELWLNNQQVGTISDTKATAKLFGSGYTGTISIALTSPKSVDVNADIIRHGTAYHIAGTLQK